MGFHQCNNKNQNDYYAAIYNNQVVGKYKMNVNYNSLLELAEKVARKIYKMHKPKRFTFRLYDTKRRTTYHYLMDMKSYSFLEYGDYRIGHEKDKCGCDTYHPDVVLPVLTNTTYPEMKVAVQPYWSGEKVTGLYRDDVFNYIHGKWYGN